MAAAMAVAMRIEAAIGRSVTRHIQTSKGGHTTLYGSGRAAAKETAVQWCRRGILHGTTTQSTRDAASGDAGSGRTTRRRCGSPGEPYGANGGLFSSCIPTAKTAHGADFVKTLRRNCVPMGDGKLRASLQLLPSYFYTTNGNEREQDVLTLEGGRSQWRELSLRM